VTANIFAKDHYRQHLLDDEMSEQLFYEYFRPWILRTCTSRRGHESLEKYKLELDNMLLDGDVTFAFEVYNYPETCRGLPQGRRGDFEEQAHFTLMSIHDRQEQEKWRTDLKEQQELWRLKIKNDILVFRLMEKAEKERRKRKGKTAGAM